MRRTTSNGASVRPSSRQARKIHAVPAVVTALAVIAAMPAAAADAAAGKAKAAACAVCHGAAGLSITPDAPNLAGQPEMYVTAQLRAYKSGARKHEVMSLMAQPLSDADIVNLAAWFASIRVEAKPPE
jgi:cytochrome c553